MPRIPCQGRAHGRRGLANLTSYANSAYLDGTPVSAAGLHDFCNGYLDVFNRGFHYAFIAAIVMMLVSLVIYLSNKRRFPDPSKKAAAGGAKASAEEITMSAQEIRQRIYALFAVFGVVIFFWVSFHQNGYSLTYFARDYVNLDVININLGFTTIKGAEIFQSVNPFFVVTLTPLIMWFFGWLRKRNIEVSTPMKIAIGMGIAATAYLFLMFFSFALPDKAALAGMKADQVQSILVTPWVWWASISFLPSPSSSSRPSDWHSYRRWRPRTCRALCRASGWLLRPWAMRCCSSADGSTCTPRCGLRGASSSRPAACRCSSCSRWFAGSNG